MSYFDHDDFDNDASGSSDFVRSFLASTSLIKPRDRQENVLPPGERAYVAPRATQEYRPARRVIRPRDLHDEEHEAHDGSRQHRRRSAASGQRQKRRNVERLVQPDRRRAEAVDVVAPAVVKRINEVPKQHNVPSQKIYVKNEKANVIMEKLATASSNGNFVYKVLVLVFSILTAIAAGGWAVTSSSSRKRGRKASFIWAWSTALALFVTMVMICLLIAFPDTNESAIGQKPVFGKDAQEIMAQQRDLGRQVGGPRLRNDDESVDVGSDAAVAAGGDVPTWAARMRDQGMNLRDLEGPRKNYRHRPEIDERYPEPLANLQDVGIDQQDYAEYMRKLEGYVDPADVQQNPYMPNAAQFPYEGHLDDAEIQHGIASHPENYMIRARPRMRKQDIGDGDINGNQALAGGFELPSTDHPWMELPNENNAVSKIFETSLSEHDKGVTASMYEELLDKSAAEVALELERDRKRQDEAFAIKPTELPEDVVKSHSVIAAAPKGSAPQVDENGYPVLPPHMRPIETKRRKVLPPSLQQAQQRQQEAQMVVPQQPVFAAPQRDSASGLTIDNHNSQDENDLFNQALNDPNSKNAAEAFANAFKFEEIATAGEIQQFLSEAKTAR